jgi:hypothetical protein
MKETPMRFRIVVAACVLAAPLLAWAGESPTKDDYADLSRLIHKMVVKQVPREHEERFNWGATVPIPEKLPLPKARTYLKVGDHLELPHGAWRKLRVKLDDADRDLTIRVKEFKKLDKGGYRVLIDSVAVLRCDGEWNQWQKGLLLLKVEGQADATIASSMVCVVDVIVNLKKFPPEVKVEPRITDLTLDLQDFKLNRIAGTLEGEKIRQLANDLMRDVLHDLLKASEPIVKDYANQAIAQGLKEGKGKLSAAELMKAAPKEKDRTPP